MAKHIHKYSVPIQWVNMSVEHYNGTGYSISSYGSKVTKLRCESCEDVIDLVYSDSVYSDSDPSAAPVESAPKS